MSQESTSASTNVLPLEPFHLSGQAKSAHRDRLARLSAANASSLAPSAVNGSASFDQIDDVLPRNDFLHQVRREIRRTERSGSPLSLICYRLGAAGAADDHRVDKLLESLYRSKRETDLVGHVGEDTIALLCPDTTGQGVGSLMNKFMAKAGNLGFETDSATFPHDLFEKLGENAAQSSAVGPFLTGDAQQSGNCYWLKRPLDIVLSLLLLAILWPLMLLVAVVIAIDSRGPILFRQDRLGRRGKIFRFFKFRSMRPGNDDSIHRKFVSALIKGGGQQTESDSGTQEQYKLQRDPRITRFGRFIRRTSIDELPQLFNVLRGDMSLVGPRPPIPYEAREYRPWHLRRVLAIKPGITGVWQVEGRSRVGFDEMVRMDLRYIRECSLALDLKLMLRTVAVVLRCDGAV